MRKIDRAILYAEEHRETHEWWLDHWKLNPPKTPEDRIRRESAGGIKHQQESIRRYNVIIDALKEYA